MGTIGLASINLAVSIAYEKTVRKVAQDTQPAEHACALSPDRANNNFVACGAGESIKPGASAPGTA
jgi:hypothetical protein